MLTIQNAKTVKGEDLGYLTGILYLAPHSIVKGVNLCPKASEGCKKACLYSAGRGAFNNVQQARIKKTELFRDDRATFFRLLIKSIKQLETKAKNKGLIPCVRLNGTSDIMWERIKVNGDKTIMEMFPHIQFYDYTKIPKRVGLPDNYHITFSRSEANEREAIEELGRGFNVSMVFNAQIESYRGFKIIDGDMHDLRFLDAKNVIIALKAKGQAKKDNSGFVIDTLRKIA